MSDGKIIDTVVHSLAGGLGSVPTLLQAPAMLIANTIINVFLTSGSDRQQPLCQSWFRFPI